MQDILQKTEESMLKVMDYLIKDLNSISTGRATPSLLDAIKVDFYGNQSSLNQVANITIPDATTISIQIWDKGMVQVVEKAISNANLGFNPSVDGQVIRVNVPKLSEERRKEMCKLAKKYGEDKKVSVRNIRRDSVDALKKNKTDFSEDDVKKGNDKIQEITDKYIKIIDDKVDFKEKDLMKI